MKKIWLFLTLVIVLAAFFRFWDLGNIPPGLWSDEAVNGNNTIEALGTHHWKVFYPENFGREGLFINIQSIFVAAFGHYPWALRLPSAIFGVLTVFGLFMMTKELFKGKERIALFAAFFLATSFWHINFSRIGFRAIMAPFFLVWSFYFLIRLLNFTDKISRRGRAIAESDPDTDRNGVKEILDAKFIFRPRLSFLHCISDRANYRAFPALETL